MEEEWDEAEREGVEKGEEVFTRGRPPPVLPGGPPDLDRPERKQTEECVVIKLECSATFSHLAMY